MIKKLRLWFGSHLMMVATKISLRIIGDDYEMHESFHLEDEDDDDDSPVYPPVQLTDRAQEMIEQARPQPRVRAPKPKPLAGSLADRISKSRR